MSAPLNRQASSRRLTGIAMVSLLAGLAAPLHAQGVLGRVRDRARQAINPPASPPARVQCATPGQTTITSDVVNRYLQSLRARQAEVRRLAQQNDAVGRYFTAVLRRDSISLRRLDYSAQTGPDWARRQQLQQRVMSGDMAAAQQMSALDQSMDPNSVPLPEVDWNTMSAATTRLDTVMVQAGGFGACEWADILEILPAAAGSVARHPAVAASEITIMGYRPDGLREGELEAIRVHRVELARALLIDYVSDDMIAAQQRQQVAQDSSSAAMNSWMACRQRVVGPAAAPAIAVPQDSLRVWAAQAQEAQKRGDQGAVMAIAQKIQAAMAPTANQQGAAMLQVYQQCGRQPGTE